jgi:hypothetical protein
MQNVWHQILRLPIIGDLIYYACYLFCVGILFPAVALISGGKRLKFGTSVFWIPRQNVQVVRDGVELLRTRDPDMFSRLTSKQRLIIYYSPELSKKSSHRLFLMHKKFIEMGAEGVACFVVQSLMIAAAVRRVNQNRLDGREKAALKSISRNMAEWLSNHSFNPGLISAYQKIVARQMLWPNNALEPTATTPSVLGGAKRFESPECSREPAAGGRGSALDR